MEYRNWKHTIDEYYDLDIGNYNNALRALPYDIHDLIPTISNLLGIPNEYLKEQQWLSVYTNEDFKDLGIVTHLAISNYKLTSVPDFKYLPTVSWLDIRHNMLTCIPDFKHLPNLKLIDKM